MIVYLTIGVLWKLRCIRDTHTLPYLPHDGVDDRMAMLSKAATCRSQVVYDHTR
jgi:hypothetical protein